MNQKINNDRESIDKRTASCNRQVVPTGLYALYRSGIRRPTATYDMLIPQAARQFTVTVKLVNADNVFFEGY